MRLIAFMAAAALPGLLAAACDDAGSDADADADVEADVDAEAECVDGACDDACVAGGERSGACEAGACVCHGDPGGPWAPEHEAGLLELDWDPDCVAAEPDDLMAELLAAAGIDQASFGYTEGEWANAGYASVLDDEALLSWFYEVQHSPLSVPCFASSIAGWLDAAADEGRAASGAIALGAWLTDGPVRPLAAVPAPADVEDPLAEALATFITLAGGEPDAGALEDAVAAVPAEVQAAVAMVVRAMGPVLAARDAWIAAYDLPAADDLYFHALLLSLNPGRTSFGDRAVRDLLVGPERQGLSQAAHDLAATIEQVDWAAVAGADATLSVETPAGRVVIGGAGDDVYEESELGEAIALLVDLGGDDTYRVRAGATASGANAVAVNIDLGGSDVYAYVEIPDRDDEDWLLPSDASDARYGGDAYNGPVTRSIIDRQGAGVLGVGLLFDLGGEGDRYQSLRGSQGVGMLGVGVLYDEGGADTYLAEASSQGAAYWGIGAALDGGAEGDERRIFHQGQGFAYVGGAGLLHDGGGADQYLADIGDPALGGHPLYYSPQRPNTGNSSFTGGAGFGRRGDEDGVFLSGGIGVLRDRGPGDDVYTASVFGLGTGYWQGTGLLVDDEGDDRYDALWYVLGGAAHYALAAVFDRSGNDTYNELRGTVGVNQGSGHDFSVGLLWDGAGDDWHYASGLGMGTGNCNGIGLFADAQGADTYVSSSGDAYGMARTSTECEVEARRRSTATEGFFLDCDGLDDYSQVPDGTGREGVVHRANDSTWLFTGLSSYDLVQHGGGLDGEGGCGLSLP